MKIFLRESETVVNARAEVVNTQCMKVDSLSVKHRQRGRAAVKRAGDLRVETRRESPR